MTPPVSQPYRRSIFFGALAGVGLAVIFFAGFFLRDVVGWTRGLNAPVCIGVTGYPLLDEVQSIIDNHYLRSLPDPAVRQYAAVRGMLSALNDRYTFFIDPPVARSEADVLAGTYGGIGVLLKRGESGDFELYPFPDGPALRAGIADGDKLVRVNGTPLTMAEQQDAVDQMLRGEVRDGSGVEITVLQALTGDPLTVFIPFEVINVPSVLWRVLADDTRIGYVQILRFTNRTPDELRTALTDLRAANVLALILDLRNNSGGLLQESIDVASQFIADGAIIHQVDRAGSTTFDATPGGLATDLPLMVLVNGNTASAAELVAGAIQDRQRGQLIGQRTYGKGTVQQIFPLSDGSSIHVTSAEWLTPARRALEGVGLDPDIPMIPDQNGRDVELGEAIRRLQQLLGL